jgi:signal transduction histidine kinase
MDIGELIRSKLDLSDPRVELLEDVQISKVVYPDLLMTAVGNILANAEKFTPENGQIKIIISHSGIEIHDTGIGIK